ncbi:MAG: hypothetical protein NVS9B12_09010 [Vulcanimicrobiaceae bacterium]
MRPLEDGDRRNLIVVAVAICLASLLLTPLAVRSALRPHPLAQVPVSAPLSGFVPLHAAPAVHLLRDPFFVARPGRRTARADEPLAPGGGAAFEVRAGDPMGIAVPAASFSVTAILTGAHPQALVLEGSRSRIVTVGDRVDGHTVVTITSQGILLDDGSLRVLAEPAP